MTTLEPPDPAAWDTTGVDLETRRVRILWGLAALGRTAEQREFLSRCQAFMEIDEALADGYVQARYQHVIISLTKPGVAKQPNAPRRRRVRQPSVQWTPQEADPALDNVHADANTGDASDATSDRLQLALRRHVAEVLERAMRDPERPTLPTELLLERRLAALRPKGGPAPGDTATSSRP
jgi:hypothetical protein